MFPVRGAPKVRVTRSNFTHRVMFCKTERITNNTSKNKFVKTQLQMEMIFQTGFEDVDGEVVVGEVNCPRVQCRYNKGPMSSIP